MSKKRFNPGEGPKRESTGQALNSLLQMGREHPLEKYTHIRNLMAQIFCVDDNQLPLFNRFQEEVLYVCTEEQLSALSTKLEEQVQKPTQNPKDEASRFFRNISESRISIEDDLTQSLRDHINAREVVVQICCYLLNEIYDAYKKTLEEPPFSESEIINIARGKTRDFLSAIDILTVRPLKKGERISQDTILYATMLETQKILILYTLQKELPKEIQRSIDESTQIEARVLIEEAFNSTYE